MMFGESSHFLMLREVLEVLNWNSIHSAVKPGFSNFNPNAKI